MSPRRPEKERLFGPLIKELLDKWYPPERTGSLSPGMKGQLDWPWF
jgi:hypothetical protein